MGAKSKVVSVEMVWRVGSGVEVLTAHGKTFLLTPMEGNVPLNVGGVNLPASTEWTSNFDLLVWVNRYFGRSIHDRERLPAGPVLRPGSPLKIQDLSLLAPIEVSVREALKPGEFTALTLDFYSAPELLRCERWPQWARTRFEFVWKMRRCLESEEVTGNLHAWVAEAFGALPRGMPKERTAPQIGLAIDWLAGSSLSAASFAGGAVTIVTSEGELMVVGCGLNGVSCTPSLKAGAPAGARVVVVGGVFFALTERTVRRLPNGQCYDGKVRGSCLGLFDDHLIFVANRFELRSRQEVLVRCAAEINFFEVSQALRLVVVCTIDGQVQFCTLKSGRVLCSVSLRETVRCVSMSKRFGFVAIGTPQGCWIFSPNGAEVVRLPGMDVQKVAWVSTPEALDFLLVAGMDGMVRVGDVFAWESSRAVTSMDSIIELAFDEAFQRVVVVGARGRISLLPICCSP